MLIREDISVDVTGSVPLAGDLTIAASVISPAEIDPDHPPVVLFGFPGGGYGRRYFDIQIPGLAGYSEAEYHAGRGWVIVSLDHLGVGESTLPPAEELTFGVLAAANDAAVRSVLAQVEKGTLVAGLPPFRPAFVLGAGQSMGGCLLIVTQSRHQTFDAVAVLGYSGLQTVLPAPPSATPAAPPPPDAPEPSVEEVAALVASLVGYAFHWEDVPAVIVDADLGQGFPVRTGVLPAWASATTPPAAAEMLAPGIVAEDAAAITVPVFVGNGERDVVPTPRAEPTAYTGTPDVTVFVVPRMAHMHNFAGTRETLWRRLHGWGEQLSHE